MKPIRVVPENSSKIQAALAEVNGSARAHVCRLENVLEWGKVAEKLIDRFVYTRRDRVGARVVFRSGDGLSHAYKYKRAVNFVTLEFRPTGVFLTKIERAEVGVKGPGEPVLFLTRDQADYAVRAFKSRFNVIGPVAVAA